MAYKTVFIVSEDPAVRDSLSDLVVSTGLRAETLPSIIDFQKEWLQTVAPRLQGCLVLDANVGDLVEPERLASFTWACARIPVLMLVHCGAVRTAVHAIRQGAVEVLQKPLRVENLLELEVTQLPTDRVQKRL